MLLLSISFVISVLFGDVETEKIGSSVSPAATNIAIFSEQNNFPRFFPPKGGRSSAFHKMLEGLVFAWVLFASTVYPSHLTDRLITIGSSVNQTDKCTIIVHSSVTW